MTFEEAKEKCLDELEQIEFFSEHDFEAAHDTEDMLYEFVLKQISQGIDRPSELAEIALQSKAIKFIRWCG